MKSRKTAELSESAGRRLKRLRLGCDRGRSTVSCSRGQGGSKDCIHTHECTHFAVQP